MAAISITFPDIVYFKWIETATIHIQSPLIQILHFSECNWYYIRNIDRTTYSTCASSNFRGFIVFFKKNIKSIINIFFFFFFYFFFFLSFLFFISLFIFVEFTTLLFIVVCVLFAMLTSYAYFSTDIV